VSTSVDHPGLFAPQSWVWVLVGDERVARCLVLEHVVEGDPEHERLEMGGHGLVTFERPLGGEWACTHPPTAVGVSSAVRFEPAPPPPDRPREEVRLS